MDLKGIIESEHDQYSNWQLEHAQIMFDALNERNVGVKIITSEFDNPGII